MQPIMKMRFRPIHRAELAASDHEHRHDQCVERDRRLDSGHGGSDIFGDRRDRHVHDRTVEKHHELSGCQRRKHQPDARPGVRWRIYHADTLPAVQPRDPAVRLFRSATQAVLHLACGEVSVTPLGEYAASRPM